MALTLYIDIESDIAYLRRLGALGWVKCSLQAQIQMYRQSLIKFCLNETTWLRHSDRVLLTTLSEV